ncbi:hypothetical protein [Luteimonas wenzhouensis]|uniref:TraB/GumN family protein n=1 Tax=Luteimonas wenzhouensis TaxID=2599615 RepID=A0A5C5TYA4_9GAMM|nr:hypothetical protein [Luteimonas wenzhouensis]TWT18265.1 hypothetical protein FQY79_10240 [Luteimonas wenzhouensis]
MKRTSPTSRIAAIVVGTLCAFTGSHATEIEAVTGTRSYLELPIDASGEPHALPYIWERSVRGKHIVVLGTRHAFDPTSPMYPRIEKVFSRVRPQLVLHESEAPAELKSMPRDQAIKVGADLGFAVHLASKHGAATRSADAPLRDEINALLGMYSPQDVLVFLTAQRLIGNVKAPNLDSAAAEYPEFFARYLVGNGFPARVEWKTWSGFLDAYENVTGQPLSPGTWDRDLFSPIKRTGRLSDLARSTNAVRDRHLLTEIRRALRDHDRVVVVFGSWHVLALEPVLEGVLKQ